MKVVSATVVAHGFVRFLKRFLESCRMSNGGGYHDLSYEDKTKTDINLIREKAWLSYAPAPSPTRSMGCTVSASASTASSTFSTTISSGSRVTE